MTHVQAMRFKGLCARAILRIFCFCDKRDMPGSMSYYPSSCIDHILHDGTVTTPLASWCQSIKAKGQHTQDGGREKEKQSQPWVTLRGSCTNNIYYYHFWTSCVKPSFPLAKSISCQDSWPVSLLWFPCLKSLWHSTC